MREDNVFVRQAASDTPDFRGREGWDLNTGAVYKARNSKIK
jgi:hypothetical protein